MERAWWGPLLAALQSHRRHYFHGASSRPARTSLPSRNVLAVSDCSSFSASNALSALFSCRATRQTGGRGQVCQRPFG